MKKSYLTSLSSTKMIKDQSLLRHEDIRQNIRILPELKAFIPPLLPDELTQLETNIRQHGCREALLVWETTNGQLTSTDDTSAAYILVDGHNRYGICQKNGIDFRVNLVSFTNLEEVRAFMIDNQLGRRNLTPEQTAYLRGLRYLNEKGERGKYERADQKGQYVPYEDSATGQRSETPSKALKKEKRTSTAQKLAEQYSVNEKTIKRDAEFAAGVDKLTPDVKAAVLSGQANISKSQIQQLGKLDVPTGSVASPEDVLTTSTPTTDSVGVTTKVLPKEQRNQTPDALRAKLRKLVDKLLATDQPEASQCDAVATCANQLKAMLLAPVATHANEGENH